MKQLQFNRDSWHYKLATSIGYDDQDHSRSICGYMRWVIGAVLVWAFVALIGAVVFDVIFRMVLTVGFFVGTGKWIIDGPAAFGFLIMTGIAGTLLIFEYIPKKIRELAQNRLDKRQPKISKPDGFLKNAYAAYKNKFCTQIEFRD